MAGILGGIATAAGWRGDSSYKIPDAPNIDLLDLAKKTAEGNLDVLPSAEALSSAANAANQKQILNMYRSVFPNFDALMAQTSKNLESGLKGELTPEEVQQTQYNSAQGALAGGYAGGTGHSALEARNLGLSSRSLIDKTLKSVESWTATIGQMMMPGYMNVQSSFVSLPQAIAQANTNAENQWKVQMMKNIEAAKPSNLEAGGAMALDAVDQLAASAASYGIGSAMGGGGMGGGGGGGGNAANDAIQRPRMSGASYVPGSGEGGPSFNGIPTDSASTRLNYYNSIGTGANWTGGYSGDYLAAPSPGYGSGTGYDTYGGGGGGAFDFWDF